MDKETILKSFAQNQILFDTVKELILSEFSLEELDKRVPDEVLGQYTRARLEGREKVDTAFRKIKQGYKTLDTNRGDRNPAR